MNIKRLTLEELTAIGDLPDVKMMAAIQLVKLTKGKDLTVEQVKNLWQVFKIQNFNSESFYTNYDKVHFHFLNWIKTQYNYGSTTFDKGDKSPGAKSREKIKALRNY